MLEVFGSSGGNGLQRRECIEESSWISLIGPTEQEIKDVQEALGIEPDFLRYPLDADEKSRVDIEEGQILVMVDIPVLEGPIEYRTIPLGIILKGDSIVTVCLRPNPILTEFSENRVKGCSTLKRNRFLLQMLMRTSALYHRYLRHINKVTEETEDRLQKAMKNTELLTLMNIEKSLVFFTTSLRGNELVLEKLSRLRALLQEEDEELLQDVIIENKQAMEMGDIYSGILSGMMDAFASIISNNVNSVMKFLTIVTIALAIPTMAASFFGMNLRLPLQEHPAAFVVVAGVSLAIALVLGFILAKVRGL